MVSKAYFFDKYDNFCYANIELKKQNLNITAYDGNNEEMGHLNLTIKDNERIVIDEIICSNGCARLGIGTTLIDIFEYLFRDYPGIVCGKYTPLNTALNVVENDQVARSFYEKNGYQIVSRCEFREHPELYPELTLEDFNATSRIYNYSLIYKQSLKKDEYRFKEANNELKENIKVKALNW